MFAARVATGNLFLIFVAGSNSLAVQQEVLHNLLLLIQFKVTLLFLFTLAYFSPLFGVRAAHRVVAPTSTGSLSAIIFYIHPIICTEHMDSNSTLDLFIKNFIFKDRRERSEFELKDSRKRVKFTRRLNHTWDEILDMRFIKKIPAVAQDYDYVIKELKIKDNEHCYVISNYDDVDGQEFEFNDAFDKVYGRGLASIIIIKTGDKLYLETEQVQGAPARFIGKK
jgi:hypothetical protein